jgi:hypothetical protein
MLFEICGIGSAATSLITGEDIISTHPVAVSTRCRLVFVVVIPDTTAADEVLDPAQVSGNTSFVKPRKPRIIALRFAAG